MRALVSAGAGVEGPGGCLALRKAVEANQLEVLRYLLDHGAQVGGQHSPRGDQRGQGGTRTGAD